MMAGSARLQLRIAQGTDLGLERPGRPRVAGQGAGQGLERPAEVGLKAHRDGIGRISKRVAEQPTEALLSLTWPI